MFAPDNLVSKVHEMYSSDAASVDEKRRNDLVIRELRAECEPAPATALD